MASAVAIVLLVILGALMVWGIIERKKVEKWLKKKWDKYFGDSPAPAPAPAQAQAQAQAPGPGPGPGPSPSPSPAEEEEEEEEEEGTGQEDDNNTVSTGGYMIESYNIKK
jgi:hypothetical protein